MEQNYFKRALKWLINIIVSSGFLFFLISLIFYYNPVPLKIDSVTMTVTSTVTLKNSDVGDKKIPTSYILDIAGKGRIHDAYLVFQTNDGVKKIELSTAEKYEDTEEFWRAIWAFFRTSPRRFEVNIPQEIFEDYELRYFSSEEILYREFWLVLMDEANSEYQFFYTGYPEYFVRYKDNETLTLLDLEQFKVYLSEVEEEKKSDILENLFSDAENKFFDISNVEKEAEVVQ